LKTIEITLEPRTKMQVAPF